MDYSDFKDLALLLQFTRFGNQIQKFGVQAYFTCQKFFADALATLSLMIQHPDELVIEPIQIQLQEKPAHCLVLERSSDSRS